jgi:hypothetical protein
MRITVPRLPDHSRGYAIVDRDDGVTYRLWGGPVDGRLPHDLVHFTVEDALNIGDGIWAAIASGVVFRSMNHLSGRRPPHAADRSDRLLKAYRSQLGRAEMVGGLVERIAHLEQLDAAMVRQLTARWLSVRPSGAALTDLHQRDGVVDTARVLAAVDRLRGAEAEWRALAVGANLVRTWPAHRRMNLAPAIASRRRACGPAVRRGRAYS